MDFITWWFNHHYVVSTLLTPFMTLAWVFYKGLVIRGIFTVIWIIIELIIMTVGSS